MKYQNKGQVMPFCLLLIIILLWVIFSNFEIGYVNFKKVQQQKEIDQITLDLTTQFARGYNEIAIINEGLTKIRNRGVIVAGFVLAVHYCAADLIPPCMKYISKLDPKLPGFYKKLYKLGQKMEEDQENIQKWMLGVYCKKKMLAQAQYKIAIYPNYSCRNLKTEELPLIRTTDEDFEGIQKCRHITIENYQEFHNLIENSLNNSNISSAEIHVMYQNYETKNKYYVTPKDLTEAMTLPVSLTRHEGDNYRTYVFRNADFETCQTFKDVMDSIGGLASKGLLLPGPLKFTDEYSNSKNRFIAMAAPGVAAGLLGAKSPFEDMHGDILGDISNNTWTISESKILGNNLQEMEFRPRLNAISLQNKLDEEIEKNPPYSSYIADFPKLSEIEDEIHH